MNSKNNLNLGDEIKDIFRDALNSNNFTKLNQNIESVTRSAIDKIRKINKPSLNYKELFTPIGKVSGILFTVFGGIGTLAFGISMLALSILSLPFGRIFNGISLVLLPFFIVTIVLLITGIKTLTRLKRAKNYMYSMNGKSYTLVKDLSKKVGVSKKFIEKDLIKMIDLGIFPEGHIDNHKTYFILTDETYEQYLDLQKGVQEKKIQSEADKVRSDNLDPDIKKAIIEGKSFVSQIKKANVEIPSHEVSLKLDKLEKVTEKIFDYVEQNPRKLSEIRKFTEYFLPTTLKLIDTYKNLDCENIDGQNISKVKLEIEETLDTINIAFENLLDGLFEDIAMDISTDISVLEIMLVQEGLTKNVEFNEKIND